MEAKLTGGQTTQEAANSITSVDKNARNECDKVISDAPSGIVADEAADTMLVMVEGTRNPKTTSSVMQAEARVQAGKDSHGGSKPNNTVNGLDGTPTKHGEQGPTPDCPGAMDSGPTGDSGGSGERDGVHTGQPPLHLVSADNPCRDTSPTPKEDVKKDTRPSSPASGSTGEPQALAHWEEIFEPRPSTPRTQSYEGSVCSEGQRSMESVGLASPPSERAEDRRKLLKIQPRTTQYEKHPLLQQRSDSGMSELEMFLLEKELALFQQPPKCTFSASGAKTSPPVDAGGVAEHGDSTQVAAAAAAAAATAAPAASSKSSSSSASSHAPTRLQPRGAHYETSVLMSKNASGFSELEMLLMEKEKEIMSEHARQRSSSLAEKTSSPSAKVAGTQEDLPDAEKKFTPAAVPPQHAQGRRFSEQPRLMPRQNQYEKHCLMESKDEMGISELARFLHEKEQEIVEKGKCSVKCACKNVNCPRCKGGSRSPTSQELTPDSLSAAEVLEEEEEEEEEEDSNKATGGGSTRATDDTESLITKTSSRRVHFKKQASLENVLDSHTNKASKAVRVQKDADKKPDNTATIPPTSDTQDNSHEKEPKRHNTKLPRQSSSKGGRPSCVLS